MKLKIASLEVEAETMEDLLELVELAQSLLEDSPAKENNLSRYYLKDTGLYERFCRQKYKSKGQKMPFRFGSTSEKEYGTRENFFAAQLTADEKILAENAPPIENESGGKNDEPPIDDGASFF